MKQAFVLFVALCVSGCATCREHPIACSAMTIVAIGAISAAASQHSNDTRATYGAARPICGRGAC